MKTLYFNCFSGISGDMTIGALLDCGLGFDYLKTELRKLPVEGYELRMSRVTRSNLSAIKFDVLIHGEPEPILDHHHEHSHEHEHQHEHGAGHSHDHQEHQHEHHHHDSGHFHRKASQILAMI